MKDTADLCSAVRKCQPLALAVGTGDCATQGVGCESKLGLDKRQESEGASLTHGNVEGSGSDDDELSGAHTPARGLDQGPGCQRHSAIDGAFPMMNEEAKSDVAHFDRFEENVEAETERASERGHGAEVSMMSTVEQDDEWRLGEVYPLIDGRLFFTAHPDDTYTLQVISMNPGAFFFSNDLPGGSPPLPASSPASPSSRGLKTADPRVPVAPRRRRPDAVLSRSLFLSLTQRGTSAFARILVQRTLPSSLPFAGNDPCPGPASTLLCSRSGPNCRRRWKLSQQPCSAYEHPLGQHTNMYKVFALS